MNDVNKKLLKKHVNRKYLDCMADIIIKINNEYFDYLMKKQLKTICSR